MNITRYFAILVFCFSAAVLPAQVIISGYVETGSLPRNDDANSGDYNRDTQNNPQGENLGFSINFGGTTYAQTFVSNNGYITFGSGSGIFRPVAFNESYAGLPIIAAFFSDVDTRDSASGIVSWGKATVDGHDAFVVKWPSVGEYDVDTFSPNSFTLILVSRSDLGVGSFDVYFDYESITWDHDGAVAGFHNASVTNPQYYQLPGSMVSGSFLDGGKDSLALRTNTGVSGGYLLQARAGEFLTPSSVVPEPSTYALLASGVTVLGLGRWLRRRRAAGR